MWKKIIYVFFTPMGRLNRFQFFGFSNLAGIMFILLTFAGMSLFPNHPTADQVSYLKPIFLIALTLPVIILVASIIALTIKRLHDINISGWWAVSIFSLPIVAGFQPELHFLTLIDRLFRTKIFV